MKKCTLTAGLVLLLSATVAAAQGPVKPFEAATHPPVASRIDRLVSAKLQELEIQPALRSSDAVFLRRVYLDVLGTLPSEREARDFLRDDDPNKRAVLIDALFERPEFADYWAMKWCDLLRVKAEFPINLWPNAVHGYHRWIRTSIAENMPYDQFARQLLTSSGSNFRVPQVNFYRAVQSSNPESIAEAVALTFMGTRIETWPAERRVGMAAFFSQLGFKTTAEWKEEIVFFDRFAAQSEDASEATANAVFPDGTTIELAADEDPRQVFADWLITEKNPWFVRSMVNRIWYWLLGRGIIHEPDDLRPDNPPSNPELLRSLEESFVAADYDMRHIFQEILNSQTYQLSSIPGSDDARAAANFAHYPLRRLEAEVLIDALCQITGTTEQYSSPIPEPFSFIPDGVRSISLADGSTTSSFLDMFGRPPRDSGLESERNNRVTAEQRLHLLNSSHIQQKIERSETLRSLFQFNRDPRENVSRLYLTILSRTPTEDELSTIRGYAQSGTAAGREVLVDVAWALINSPEFLYRH